MAPPTSRDILAAAALLGVAPEDVPVLANGWRRRTIAETAGDLPCDDCHAEAGQPCDVTIEH